MHTQICIKAENKEKRKETIEPKLKASLLFFSLLPPFFIFRQLILMIFVLCILGRSVIVLIPSLTCVGLDEAP
jgi:hypothetical protein